MIAVTASKPGVQTQQASPVAQIESGRAGWKNAAAPGLGNRSHVVPTRRCRIEHECVLADPQRRKGLGGAVGAVKQVHKLGGGEFGVGAVHQRAPPAASGIERSTGRG